MTEGGSTASLNVGPRVHSVDVGEFARHVSAVGTLDPINPGSPTTGAIVTTSFIVAPHLAQTGHRPPSCPQRHPNSRRAREGTAPIDREPQRQPWGAGNCGQEQ